MSFRSWDRLPNEKADWFDRFDRFYRPIGPERSLAAAYRFYYNEKHGINPERPGATTSWETIAKEWHWKERAEAWDAEMRARRLEQEEESLQEMNTRHLQVIKAILSQAVITIADKGFKNPGTALQAAHKAILLERSIRGVPAELVDVYEMSEEELDAALAKQLEKAGIRQTESSAEAETSGVTDESESRE